MQDDGTSRSFTRHRLQFRKKGSRIGYNLQTAVTMQKRVAFALLCLVAPAGAGVKVFDANKDLHAMETGSMMTALIIFTIIFEYLTHKLNHITQEHHHVFVELVAKIYKEIMILGFISFTLTICLQMEQGEPNST